MDYQALARPASAAANRTLHDWADAFGRALALRDADAVAALFTGLLHAVQPVMGDGPALAAPAAENTVAEGIAAPGPSGRRRLH